MTIVASLLLTWIALHLAGDTRVGRIMHQLLVAWPARQLSRITPGHAVLTVLLLIGGAGLYWLMREEAFLVLGMAAPEILAWASMFEISMIVDLFTFAVLTASSLKVKPGIVLIRTAMRPLGKKRARTSVRARPRPASANDDDDGPTSAPLLLRAA